MADDNTVEVDPKLNTDYYARLNVPKNATKEEIKNAFKKDAAYLHPDKHVDSDLKKKAESAFNRIREAYDVLSDEKKRAIYDTLGEDGLQQLKNDCTELTLITGTAQEIRDKFERLQEEEADRQLLKNTNPRVNLSININASELFEGYDHIYSSPNHSIEVTGMQANVSVDAPLTRDYNSTLSGQIGTHNGTGSGQVCYAVKTVSSEKSWTQVEVGAGNGAFGGVKFSKPLTKHITITMAGSMQVTHRGSVPSIELTLGRQLDTHLNGFLTWKTLSQPSLNTMVVWNTEDHFLQTNCHLGLPHCFVGITYHRKLKEKDTKFKTAIRAGTFGALFEYGVETKLSTHSTIGATMCLGIPVGVILKLRLNRGNQTYTCPIFLSEQIMPSTVFYGTITPLISWFAIQALIIKPYLKREKEREIRHKRSLHRKDLEAKKTEALYDIQLMRDSVQRKRDKEAACNGLLIDKAVYGNLDSYDADFEQRRALPVGPDYVDVTIPVQNMVEESSLFIVKDNKSGLKGFFDPCYGEPKELFIRYIINGVMHETRIKDDQDCQIPRRNHRTDEL